MDHANTKALADYYNLLAISIVEQPSELKISIYSTPVSVSISVQSHSNDYGRLLGVSGRMYNACQTLLRATHFTNGMPVKLIIDCPLTSERIHTKFVPVVNWSEDDDRRMGTLLEGVSCAIFPNAVVENRRISQSASQFTLNPKSHIRDSKVTGAIDVWFTAVGRCRGRVVYLDVL